jgi:glycosyltransferase involved in cell wall biosynthesis
MGFALEYASALWGEWWCALKAWRRGGFDVIHLCNPPDLLFTIALPFKWLAGVRIIFDVHDLWPEMFEAKFGRRGLLYWAVRLAERCSLAVADAVIATNDSVLRAVTRRGDLPPWQTSVVRTAPSLLDTGLPADPALNHGRKYLVGYVGVMGDADGVGYLINAAAHIVQQRQRHDVQFLLMGTGPEYEDLLRLRDSLGLATYVSMPGRVSNEALFTGLKTMDVGVACDPANDYNDHCTMNKTLEYMAFAKPQVMFATVEGRVSAGESAVYVLQNTAEALGDAILELLDDPAKCARLGAAGYQRLTQKLNWELSVKQLCAVYEQVLRTKQEARHRP